MNSVIIKQSLQTMEYLVPASVITTLVGLSKAGASVELEGNITISGNLYDDQIEYLQNANPNLNITCPTVYIHFQSPEIESVLLNNGFSSDGIGITDYDARTLKSEIPLDLFKNNQNITTFNELGKFTSVVKIGRTAFDSSSITEINLKNISEISYCGFGNTRLNTVNAPNLMRLDAGREFYRCTIDNVSNLGKITTIGMDDWSESLPTYSQTFGNSTIGNLVIPQTVTKINRNAFNGATINNLLCDESQITHFGGFYSYVKDVWNLKNTIAVVNGLFVTTNDQNQTTIQNQIYFPKLPKTKFCEQYNYGRIYHALFTGQRRDFLLCSLMYFRDITQFGAGTFNGCTIDTLVINNTTPPSIDPTTDSSVIGGVADINTNVFSQVTSISKLYVPDSAVSTYQADSKYNSIGVNNILPLSSCPSYATEEAWIAAGKPVALIEEYE